MNNRNLTFLTVGVCMSLAVCAQPKSITGIDKFDETNIFCRNQCLPGNYVIQGFNLDTNGSLWLTNTGPRDKIVLTHVNPDSSDKLKNDNLGYMVFKYFGHGTNTAIEEEGDDRYFWVGCFGSSNKDGFYWTEKLVGRVKFVPGDTITPDKCDEYYYIGEYDNMHPSIDKGNDLLTINYSDPVNGSFRCFVVYRLSEARNAPLKDITIACTDAFKSGDKRSLKMTDVKVTARDLTQIIPVARPKFLKSAYGKDGDKYYAWQGYDVHEDKLYYCDGQSHLEGKPGDMLSGYSKAYLTVFDLEGNVVEPRSEISIIGDPDSLARYNLSHFWSMESEGVKVIGSTIYLGFGAIGADKNEPQRRTNHIFKFCKAN